MNIFSKIINTNNFSTKNQFKKAAIQFSQISDYFAQRSRKTQKSALFVKKYIKIYRIIPKILGTYQKKKLKDCITFLLSDKSNSKGGKWQNCLRRNQTLSQIEFADWSDYYVAANFSGWPNEWIDKMEKHHAKWIKEALKHYG